MTASESEGLRGVGHGEEEVSISGERRGKKRERKGSSALISGERDELVTET